MPGKGKRADRWGPVESRVTLGVQALTRPGEDVGCPNEGWCARDLKLAALHCAYVRSKRNGHSLTEIFERSSGHSVGQRARARQTAPASEPASIGHTIARGEMATRSRSQPPTCFWWSGAWAGGGDVYRLHFSEAAGMKKSIGERRHQWPVAARAARSVK